MKQKIFACLISIASFSPCFAAEDYTTKQDQVAYENFLSRINHYSPLEGSGSRGSIGYALGMGVHSSPIDHGSRLIRQNVYTDAEKGPKDGYMMPKVFFSKGLPWPIDLGMSYGILADGRTSQTSGHIQWTVYESFALPAFSLRGSISKLTGLQETAVESFAIEANVSYGFLSYFNVYGRFGWQRNRASYRIPSEAEYVFLQGEGVNDRFIKRTWTKPFSAWGLAITVLPPFIVLTCEAQMIENAKNTNYLGKIAVSI